MPEIDLRPIIDELESINESDLISELQRLNLSITGNKFHNAFSAYGLSNFISGASLDVLKSNIVGMPDDAMEGIRWNSVILLRGYIAMVYMRSDQLETGINNLEEASPIYAYKKYLGRGRASDNSDTISQHIRNSFSHGSFELSGNLEIITFSDRNWIGIVKTSEFIDEFCEQVFKFYAAAFSLRRQAKINYPS